MARLEKREIGSGAEEQAQRSLRQARAMANQDTTGVHVVPTDGQTTMELAEAILQQIGWLRSP